MCEKLTFEEYVIANQYKKATELMCYEIYCLRQELKEREGFRVGVNYDEEITVKELIRILEQIPSDKTVEVTVTYDNTEHIQPLGEVYHHENFNWITLRGKKP